MTRTEAKRAETKAVKSILRGMGFTSIRVGHSMGGWLDISVDAKKPDDCFCDHVADVVTWYGVGIVPSRLGRCQSCTSTWERAWRDIKHEARVCTGRTGEYDGYIFAQVSLV